MVLMPKLTELLKPDFFDLILLNLKKLSNLPWQLSYAPGAINIPGSIN